MELAALDEVEVSSAEIWPVHKVIEVLLSPHNRAFSALLTGAFRAPLPSENCCKCCVTTYQPLISLRPNTHNATLILTHLPHHSSRHIPLTHNTHGHPFIPHMAEEQALKEEAASTPSLEGKREVENGHG